jgi:asparagine synthase (glutamine-hydrolysing)
VEVRLPFLDWRVVELSLATPVAFKFHQGWSKWPLRQAAAARLSQDVAWRKRKLGFEAPDRLWLQALRPRMKSAVAASPMLADLFDRPRLLAGFDALARPLAWRLFSLAAWEAHQGIGGLE